MKNKTKKHITVKKNHQAADERYLLLNKLSFQQSFTTLINHFKNDPKS